MRARVQVVIEGEQSAAGEQGGEMGLVGGHDELDVGTGFVEKVTEDRAGDDVGGFGSTAPYRGLDDGHGAVRLELASECVPHVAQVVETFFVGADEQDCYRVLLLDFLGT